MSIRFLALSRLPLLALAAIAVSGLFSNRARAQLTKGSNEAWGGNSYEIRPFIGGYVPTGDQREYLKDATFIGAQGAWHATQQLAFVGLFGFAPTSDKLNVIASPQVDMFRYDMGVELSSPRYYVGSSWDFSPFLGAGLGGCTYSYRHLDVSSKTMFEGYGALGGDIGSGQVALRLEARDYISRFKPLLGTENTSTRNDVSMLAGLVLRF